MKLLLKVFKNLMKQFVFVVLLNVLVDTFSSQTTKIMRSKWMNIINSSIETSFFTKHV